MSNDIPAAMIAFARVVEAGSFTGAAARLGLSKSAVSKQIARLESHLGAQLLHRTTRRLSATEVGAALYERCARIAEEVEAAEEIASRLHAVPRGQLRVNAPVTFGHQHLGPCLADFLGRHPEVRLELTLNDRIIDLVEEGFDLAIRISSLTDSSLIARRLAPARRVLCAAPAYLQRRGVPMVPADLSAHACLIYTLEATPREWRFRHSSGGPTETVRIDGPLQANNGEVLLAAAISGLGIAMTPSFIAGPDIAAGRLVRLLPDYDDQFGGVYAVYPPARHLSPKVRAFVDFLAERFGPEPPWEVACAAQAVAPPNPLPVVPFERNDR